MKATPRVLVLLAMCLVIFPISAYAYLDPVAGSIAWQAAIGGLLAALATAGIYWKRFKSRISRPPCLKNESGVAPTEVCEADRENKRDV